MNQPAATARSRLQVNAEIHIGTRTVLEYLLSPVQEVTREGAGTLIWPVFSIWQLSANSGHWREVISIG